MKTLFSLFIGLTVLSTTMLPLSVHAQDEPATKETEKKAKKAKSFPFKFEKSLKKALTKAKRSNVPVMLLFTNPPTCPYCVKLEQEVLNTKEWKKGVAGKLIGVYIDNGSKDKDAAAFAKENGVSGIPTYFILSPEGAIIGRGGYSGGRSVADYVKSIDEAYKKVQAEAEAKAEKAEED